MSFTVPMIAYPVRRYNPVSAYAYPGHEALREAMAALVARLALRHLSESRVEKFT